MTTQTTIEGNPMSSASGHEPLLVAGMRRHPTGEVRHVPDAPTGACGTSTAGFLRELDEWAAAIRAATLREALLAEQSRRCAYGTTHGDGRTCDCKFTYSGLPRTSEMTGCPEMRAALDVLAASPAPTGEPDEPLWGIQPASGCAVVLMRSEAAARTHAADPTRGGTVVRHVPLEGWVPTPTEEVGRG